MSSSKQTVDPAGPLQAKIYRLAGELHWAMKRAVSVQHSKKETNSFVDAELTRLVSRVGVLGNARKLTTAGRGSCSTLRRLPTRSYMSRTTCCS